MLIHFVVLLDHNQDLILNKVMDLLKIINKIRMLIITVNINNKDQWIITKIKDSIITVLNSKMLAIIILRMDLIIIKDLIINKWIILNKCLIKCKCIIILNKCLIHNKCKWIILHNKCLIINKCKWIIILKCLTIPNKCVILNKCIHNKCSISHNKGIISFKEINRCLSKVKKIINFNKLNKELILKKVNSLKILINYRIKTCKIVVLF